MDVTKQIVAPVASAIAMALLMFAPSANAQNDRTAFAYDPLGATGWSAPDLERRPDPVAESFFRMLAHMPAVEPKTITLRADADPLREVVLRALWSTNPVDHLQVEHQLPAVSPAASASDRLNRS